MNAKTATRVEIATKAVIEALEHFNDKNPGKCIIKRMLFPSVVTRGAWIMEENYDPSFDSEAIPPPDNQFLRNHWPDICLQAAEKYDKYIVWETRTGVRLGTFDEFMSTRNLLALIAEGLGKNIEGRDRIVVKQGGVSFQIDVIVKQLPSGITTA